MYKAVHYILVLLIFIVLIRGSYGIKISFSGGNPGGEVGISNSYHADKNMEVKEVAIGSFDDASMTVTRSVSGSGDTDMHQKLYGTGGGADYFAYNLLRTRDATKLLDKSSSKLIPVSCDILRHTTAENSTLAETALYGHQGGGYAGAKSHVEEGNLRGNQTLAVGKSVEVSQSIDMNGGSGYAYVKSGDVYGLKAKTGLDFDTGNAASDQISFYRNLQAVASQT